MSNRVYPRTVWVLMPSFKPVTADGFTLAENLSPPDARRLVAAWNAFENVRTDLVEFTVGSGAMQAAADAMEKLPAVQTELNAARALLREALEAFHDFPDQDHEIADRIESYLDACDKLEGKPNAS